MCPSLYIVCELSHDYEISVKQIISETTTATFMINQSYIDESLLS